MPPKARRDLRHAPIIPACVALAALAPLSAQAAAPSGSAKVLRPAADAFVSAAKPTTNYGGGLRLRAGGSAGTRSYLRFRVPETGRIIASARLRLFSAKASRQGYVVHQVATPSWGERTVTFRTAPALSPVVLARSGPVRAGRWTGVDLGRTVASAGTYSFALTAVGNRRLAFASHRAGIRGPKLVLRFGPPRVTGAGGPGSPGAQRPIPPGPGGPSPPPASGTQPVTFPIRMAFYYPWFTGNWGQQGIVPYTRYHPSLGLYDSGNEAVIKQQIQAMQYGNIRAGISSWFGPGTLTDQRLPAILRASAGTGFLWAVYYEPEGTSDPSPAQITSDLTYLRDHYARDPSFLHLGGKFVVFVYSGPGDGCGMADRWRQANTVGAYVVLSVFPGFQSCTSQPDWWHQYAPANAEAKQAGLFFSISPGFYKVTESSARLPRDPATWQQNVRDMVASNAPFQLVTTFNEWGEGTAVESADEWKSPSGYGVELDALHTNGS